MISEPWKLGLHESEELFLLMNLSFVFDQFFKLLKWFRILSAGEIVVFGSLNSSLDFDRSGDNGSNSQPSVSVVVSLQYKDQMST